MNNDCNKKPTFFVYDYETFGINPALDRPAQFSGIRTDNNFFPLENSQIFFCRPPSDYLPDPEAVLLTEINPLESLKKDINESEFARHIHKPLTVPNTCILGYNNNHFDDEFNRNIFYRNFYDPYNWSWKNNNSTWDLLHVTYACYILRPSGIIWPKNNKNFTSFRLQDLSKSNNIQHDQIHNSTSDVYATLKLAQLIKKAQPKLFKYFYEYRKKQKIKTLIDLQTMEPLIYIPTNRYNEKYITWICPITWHPNNPNILISCDLNTNIEILKETNFNTLTKKILQYSHHNKQTILKLIHINKCPILAPTNTLRTEDINRLNINTQYLLNNFKKLQQYISKNKNFTQIITTLYTKNNITQFKNKNWHVDNQLYNGFFNNYDQNIITIIRNSTPESLKKLNIHFHDSRLQPLLFYYRARNFFHTLNKYEKNHWIQYQKKLFTKKIFINYTQKINRFINIYIKQTKKIILLNALKQYLHNIYKNL